MTVIKNDKNELVTTRLVTGGRVCIDYRKLNEATRKDHFPLPFMDQMLERLAGNEYYCFLDGFSGYFQIPIDPKDQEKTTFTCPYGTFAYKRMPFGLCNAPGTFQRCMMAIFHDMIEQTMKNGNGLVSITTDTNGMIKVLPPKTAEEVVARERERKERTTLLMALPEDHLENSIRWLMQKRCRKLSNQGTTTSSSNTHNVAFVSAKNTSSTNDINDDDMEEMVLKWQVAMISMKIKKFHKRTGRKLQFDAKDPVGFDKTKVECFNCHKMRHFARDYRAKGNQDSRRRDVGYNGNKTIDNGRRPAYQDDSKDLVTIDEEDIDWSGHVEEDAQNYALMAYSSSNSGSDNENSSKNISRLVNTQMSANDKFGLGVETTTSMLAPVENAPKVVYEPKVWTDAPIIEEYESDSDNDSVENVKETGTPNHSPKIEKQDRNGHTRKGLGYALTRKACFVCGSFSHLIRDCDFHEKRMAKQAELSKSKNKDDPHRALKNKRIVDSVCSRHMTGNKAHLANYQEFKGDSVAFGGSNERITGK
nr:reverse transcriptase domain-containing protein [Tanacetum cinerariifolium]